MWQKVWLETRWRFLIGLAVLVMLACGGVFEYPATARLLPAARSMQSDGGLVGRAIRDAIAIQSNYRGFIWWQWVHQNFTQLWSLFAILLGSGGLIGQGASGALFTLSMPVSRTKVIGVRAAVCFAELLILALVPSMLIPVLSPAIGESYPFRAAVVHALCMSVGGACIFSFALLMSTTFTDLWRPALVTCAIVIGLALVETALRQSGPYGLFAVMSGERYFREAAVPWAGLLISFGVAASLLYGAAGNLSQQDF